MSISSGGIIWQPGGGGGGDDPGGGEGGGKFQLLAVRCLTTSGTYNMQADIDAIAAGTFEDTTYSDSGLKASGEVTHIKRQLIGGGGGGHTGASSNETPSFPGVVTEDSSFVPISLLPSSIPFTIGAGGGRGNDGGTTVLGELSAEGGYRSSTSRNFGLRQLFKSSRPVNASGVLANNGTLYANGSSSERYISSANGPGCGSGRWDPYNGGDSYYSDSSLIRLGGSEGQNGQNANSYRGFGAGGGSRQSANGGSGGIPGGGSGIAPSTINPPRGGRGEVRIEFWGMA